MRFCCSLALPLLGGCGSEADAVAGAVIRDSAGIQIVDNRDPLWSEGEGWRLSPEPVLRIGELEGAPPYQLDRVVDAERLADGRIVVANAGSQELRFYEPSGAHLHSVGGEGGGPGEFEGLTWIEVAPGDSLIAYDLRNRRLSRFTPDGEFVGSTTLEGAPERGFPRAIGRFADGSLLVSVGRVFGPGEVEEGMSRDSVVYLHLSAEGELLDTIVRFPGPETFLKTEDQDFTVTTPLFGRSPADALHADRVTLGASDSYQLVQYTPDGVLRRIIRKPHDPRPVTDATWEAAKRERLEAMSDDTWRRRIGGMLDEMPQPSTMPAHGAMMADIEGNLWVRNYSAPGETEQRWSVFDAEGRLLGTVRTPERFRPTQIGSDWLLGVWSDEFDVQYVTMYELEKPGSGSAD